MNRVLVFVAFLAVVSLASGSVIFQNLAGPQVQGATVFDGESFTTPAGGPWDDITFNYYSNAPATTPSAVGDAFLLTAEYLGTPAALSAATPGFLAESTGISSGVWLFAPGVVLNPSTQYWVYEDAGQLASGDNTISGGQGYFADSSGLDYSSAGGIALNFTVSGSVAPEPATAGLMAAALGALAIAIRRSAK